MRAKSYLFSLLSALLLTILLPHFQASQANVNTLMSQSLNDYRIEVRLDHVRQVLILDMKNAPFGARNFIEVQTLTGSNGNLNVSYIPVFPGEDGHLRVELPCTSSLTDADIRLTAFAIDPAGLIHQSHYWTLQRRHLNLLSDSLSQGPEIERELVEEAYASVDGLNPASAMSIRYYNTGISHLYVSDNGLGFGQTAFNSSGTLYSAEPSLGMRLSAGPAGVFTAN